VAYNIQLDLMSAGGEAQCSASIVLKSVPLFAYKQTRDDADEEADDIFYNNVDSIGSKVTNFLIGFMTLESRYHRTFAGHARCHKLAIF
jgi:hypothetical protein